MPHGFRADQEVWRLDFQRFKTTLKARFPSANAMNAEPSVTASEVAQHLGGANEEQGPKNPGPI